MDLILPGREPEEDYEAKSALSTLLEAERIKAKGGDLRERILEQIQCDVDILQRVAKLVEEMDDEELESSSRKDKDDY